MATKRTPPHELPPDVEPGQVWREREGEQHWFVESVHKDTATLQRCTPAGTVLNRKYRTTRTGDQLRTGFTLVKHG